MTPKIHHHTLIWIIAILVAILAGVIVLSLVNKPTVTAPIESKQRMNQDMPELPITATFRVVINGQKRSFNLPMYFDQSKEVYIESANPEQVVVNEQSITWGEFFNTLPFSVQKNCIITGNKETYCTNETQTLTFTLNGQPQPDVLDKLIMQGDTLEISY